MLIIKCSFFNVSLKDTFSLKSLKNKFNANS